MIDPGLAAVIASFVSLVLGTTGILRSSSDSRKAARREQIQRRAEAYLDLLRVVETRGLAVQDEMYNLTETEDDESPHLEMPHRKIDAPPRADRAEALALAAAHGTTAIREALNAWIAVLESWEHKRDVFAYDYAMIGPSPHTAKDAEPERADELATRKALGESVSSALRLDI